MESLSECNVDLNGEFINPIELIKYLNMDIRYTLFYITMQMYRCQQVSD